MNVVEPLEVPHSGAGAERLHLLEAAELTDPDGDALTVTRDGRTVWLTCTTDGDEVTVGPFPAEALRQALEGSGPVARVA